MATRRNTEKYKKWRRAVRRKDGHKCVKCGNEEHLNTHHIESWAHNPKLRYEVSNGITLCARCHYLFHEVFLGSAKIPSTKEKTKEFLKSFKCGLDHPINYKVFMMYLRIRRYKKKRKKT